MAFNIRTFVSPLTVITAFFLLQCCNCADILTSSQFISDVKNEFLLSANGKYRLGFFSPRDSYGLTKFLNKQLFGLQMEVIHSRTEMAFSDSLMTAPMLQFSQHLMQFFLHGQAILQWLEIRSLPSSSQLGIFHGSYGIMLELWR